MLNNCLVYNSAECFEFCAHFPGSQKSPTIQTAADSSTFRVSYVDTQIASYCNNTVKNCKQATAYIDHEVPLLEL